MRRIYLDATCQRNPQPDTCITLPAAEAYHLHHVLRLQVGDTVVAFDGSGTEWHLQLTQVTDQEVKAQVLSSHCSKQIRSTAIILGQAVPKSTKMDLIVEKCSELGLTTLIPLYTDHTVVREVPGRLANRLARWRRIATAAAKQCGRPTLLDIYPPQGLSEFCTYCRYTSAKLLCWEGESQRGVRHLLETLPSPQAGQSPGSIAVLIGPEGGWSHSEVERASAHGFIPISLGPYVLRTETAAIAITSLIRYSQGDLEPQVT